MKRNTLLFCLTILLALPTALSLFAQGPGDPEKEGALPSVQGANAEGTRFIVGFMQNEESTSICALFGGRDLPRHRIAIASRLKTDVTITYPNGTTLSRTLEPFQIWSLQLDGEQYECLDDGVCAKSFEIVSEEPVSVYCFSSKTHTSDGYLALPISSWGTEYYTANAPVDQYTPRPWEDPDGCLTESVRERTLQPSR